MYYNRKNVFKRLDAVVRMGFTVCTYTEYIRTQAREIDESD
jgi:hypothetical protein